MLNIQLPSNLNILKRASLINRSSLNNYRSLERIRRAFLVERASTIAAEVESEIHSELVCHYVGLKHVCTFSDLEIGGGNDEIGGEGATGYFVAFVAVADGLVS